MELRNVDVYLETSKILDDLSWRVPANEHWSLIGPNGSGKTTLLRLINGYLWPAKGTVKILGNLFGNCDLREIRRSIGFVSSHLIDWIPPGEKTVDLVQSGKFASTQLWEKSSSQDKRKAQALLDLVHCGHVANTPYGILSQGEKQSVLIARALMSDPKLLVLDEPCVSLDLAARERFLDYLGRIGYDVSGPTMIFVTHHVEEVVPVFGHVLLIKGGRVIAKGRTENVLSSHNLSKAFGVSVQTQRRNGRYYTTIL